jgi:predicted PurR-regulated permease PerM
VSKGIDSRGVRSAHVPAPFGPIGLWVTALIIVILWGAVVARPFLIPVSIAAFIAFLLAPLVRVLNRRGVPDAIAIALSLLILVLPIALLGFLLVRQGQTFLEDFPRIVDWVKQTVLNLNHHPLAIKFGVAKYLSVQAIAEKVTESAGQGIQILLGGLRALLDVSSQAVLVTIFAVVMLASRRHLRDTFERILAQFENIQAAKMLDVVTGLVERFLVARLAIVVVIGITSGVALSILGLKYSLLVGAFIGVMTLVPAIGFIIGMLAAVIVALATGHSGLSVILITAILLLFNILEGNILTPLLVGKHLNVNALFTFLGFFAGGLLWGVWGMFLSVPILGVLRIALSLSPTLEPWGALLAAHEDRALILSLVRRRLVREPI